MRTFGGRHLTSTLPQVSSHQMVSKAKYTFHIVGMQGFCESFCEDIRDVVDRGNMFELDLSITDSFTDVVVVYVDVFCMLMTFCREGECNSRGVVTVEGSQEGLVKSDLPQKCVHP